MRAVLAIANGRDESIAASLIVDAISSARSSATRLCTWLVVGNGAALTLCYQAMLSPDHPDMLPTVAMFFVAGMFLAFFAYIQFQNGITVSGNMFGNIYLTRIAERTGLKPPPRMSEKEWAKLLKERDGWSGVLWASAICFAIGALAPTFGVLERDFLDLLLGPSTTFSEPAEAPPPLP